MHAIKPAEPTQPRSLALKLVQVMAAVGRVQKRGRNTQQGYEYATEADIADAVREALAEQKVLLLTNFGKPEIRTVTTAKGSNLTVASVMGEFTFIDAESGESITRTFPGEGMDSGDKAIYKAMTGAEKYALLKTFLIPTGDDPEKDSEPPKSRTEAVKEHLKSKTAPAQGLAEARRNDIRNRLAALGYPPDAVAPRIKEILGLPEIPKSLSDPQFRAIETAITLEEAKKSETVVGEDGTKW